MPEKSLTDLPPELLDYITAFLSTASDLANLSRVNRNLHTFVEKDAWQTFAKRRFPTLCPPTVNSFKTATRTLTSLSRAWDRRAFVSRYTEPHGDITAYPGGKKVERWKRPKGQTIGFTPHLDVFEENVSSNGKRETLAWSAGAEIVIRHREWRSGRQGKEKEKIWWLTYRPLTAREGHDDVTTLHLMRPQSGENDGRQGIITGTARGDLQLLQVVNSNDSDKETDKTHFTTQGQPVRSSSLLQRSNGRHLLAAEVGDSKICLYDFDGTESKVVPSGQVDVKPVASRDGATLSKAYRAWSTNFLSEKYLAIGLGPSEEPLHVYTITQAGISPDYVRKFSLQPDFDDRPDEMAPGGVANKPMSSIYPIAGLPPSSAAASSSESQVFLSGAYDGVVRLHDLRSPRDVETIYIDPTDDSAIYSLLSRGREALLVGTSRHNLLKVFDLRLGSKCYSYHPSPTSPHSKTSNYSLFLKPSLSSGSANAWASRSSGARTAESSIYSLASASAASPHIYTGIENSVVELAFTDVLDQHPDPVYFRPWNVTVDGKGENSWNGWRTKDVLSLAGYDEDADMRLMTQRSLTETWVTRGKSVEGSIDGLDARWRSGGS